MPVDLGSKIKKKTYRFELKKKYQYVLHYKVKERPPIERVKDAIRKLMTPPAQKKEAPAAIAPLAAQPKGGFNFMIFGAFILIALIIIIMGWLFLSATVLQAGAPLPSVEKPSIENWIVDGNILTAGDRTTPQHVAAVLVDYNTSNLNNYSINITTFDAKVPSEVFILNSEKVEATSYPDFIRVLRADLAKRKIILNEITLKQLETLPQGAVVIVPSGTIPKELIGIDSSLSMNTLADRGVVVVYVGQPFTQMLNGSTVMFTPSDVVNNLPVRFDENADLQSTDGFNLFQPLYRVTTQGGWRSDIAYGSVSLLERGNGAFVFVPQTLDGGWRGNFTSAADDISRIVFETPWAQPNAPSKVYTFTNQSSYSGTEYFFSNAFTNPNATVKVDFIGYSTTSNYPIEQTLYTRLDKQNNNELFVEGGGQVVTTNITNQPIRLNAQLREPVASQPSMALTVTDVNNTDLQTFPEGNVNLQADRSFDVLLYTDRGEYLVKLADDSGKVYAEGYMNVVSVDFNFTGNNRDRHSIYNFAITMAGTPKTLSDVTVKVDNGTMGTYTFSNVDQISVDVGQYTGGEFLPPGKHTFAFTAGGLTEITPYDNSRQPTIFENPIFIIVIVLTGGMVAIGAIFARQEQIFFSLDIPDFPPVARTRIGLAPDSILGIFEKVNENYRWQNTPLTTQEIKNGFKDIFIQGKPVYITDYNVEFILEELEKRGTVKESLNYYGLASWEQKSAHSIEYLALLRRVRDICVNNAIPFTGVDESKDSDTNITVVGQQMSVHFYERGMDLAKLFRRVLPTIGHGIAIILLKSKVDKDYLQMTLNSSPSVAPLIVKMETDSSSLLFLTTDELEKMLLEFKSM